MPDARQPGPAAVVVHVGYAKESGGRRSNEVVVSVSVTLTQQPREVLCLPLQYVPGWLFGINADRVRYDCYTRLADGSGLCLRMAI